MAPKPPTIDDICEHYFSKKRGKTTGEGKLRMVLKVLLAELGDLPITELTLDRQSRYIFARENGLIGRGVTCGTIRTELSYLNAAINLAVKWGLLDAALQPTIDLPPPAEARERWLTYEELDTLRGAAEGRLRWFIDIAYYTASRRQAVETLTWFQVDRSTKKIRLNPEGRRQTRKRRPVVPIVSDLDNTLASIPKENSYVLGGRTPIYPAFMALVKSLGLEKVTPHTLRHTRAVHLAQQGISLYTIAGLLGDTISTVEKNYLHHCPDHLGSELEGAKSSAR